jgi:Xaa-Pro aminopeptidase
MNHEPVRVDHAAADPVKIARFRQAFTDAEFDAIVAASPENTWYLSEAVIDTQRSLLERLAVVVWVRGKDPVYIVCTNEEIQARRDSWIDDIRGYVEYQQSPMQLVADALAEGHATRGTVGIEHHFLNAYYYQQLRILCPDARFTEVGPWLDQVRSLKTPEEIRRLEIAAQITDRAIWTAFHEAARGMAERDVGARLTSGLLLGGADMQAFQVLAAGINTCATHHRAGDYVLARGDLMRTDFGGIFPGGYYSDLARTIAVGASSPKQRDTYAVLWEEHERLIGMMRPGITARELYDAHRGRWNERGWPMLRPHIGHGLGIGLHEFPVLMPSEETPLAPGMVLAIEPNYLDPGREKYHVEDLVLITEGAPRVLSRAGDWSSLFVAGA